MLGLFGSVDTDELDKAQKVVPVGTLGMGASAPGHPAFEHLSDDPVRNIRRGPAVLE
jgi:hypothetical protein